MKLYRNILLFGTLALAGLISCEPSSDVQSPQQLEHRMEINPDSLVGNVFQQYKFRARVTNYASSDLRFEWFINNKYVGYDHNYLVTSFSDTGIFSIRVRALSAFDDAFVAEDSITVFITSAPVSIDLVPSAIDTTLLMNSTGALTEPLTFTVKTTKPEWSYACLWHVWGAGVDSTFYAAQTINYLFPAAGDYMVSVNVSIPPFNFGSDTSTVRIRFPQIDLSMLQASSKVSVYLYSDSTNSILYQKNYKNPLAIGLPFISDATHSFTWSPFAFSVAYFTETGVGTSNYHKADDRIAGSFSADHRDLTSIETSVADTSFKDDGSIREEFAARYGFKLSNLQLLSITPTEIIFSSGSRPMVDFVSNAYFYYNSQTHSYSPCGTPYNLSIIAGIRTNRAPARGYGLVVFSR